MTARLTPLINPHYTELLAAISNISNSPTHSPEGFPLHSVWGEKPSKTLFRQVLKLLLIN